MIIFNSKDVDGQQLIPPINLLFGDDIVGAEIGTFMALTACTIIQNCPSIKKLYVVDSWKPYNDYIKLPYDKTPAYSYNENQMNYIKQVAMHNIENSGHAGKIEVLDMDTNDAAEKIEDGSLDFIFLDAHMTIDQLINDLSVWYGKVKIGGLLAVHDCHNPLVYDAVSNFVTDKKDGHRFSRFETVFMWVKNPTKGNNE